VLPAGAQSVFAVYRGDSKYAPGDSPVLTQTVNRDSTTTTVTSSANPSVSGQKVTFTATVKVVAPGSGTPTGTVTFYNGSTVLGTGSLSGGIATFTTSSLSVGTHSIKAVYSGSSDCQTSTSAVLTQVVNTSAASPAVAMGPSVVDQVLAVVQNQSSQEVLIGDLAFEQLSNTKPWRK
jgi:Bacterial Ig-like domain (group 3)